MGLQRRRAPVRVFSRAAERLDLPGSEAGYASGICRPDDRPWLHLQWLAMGVQRLADSGAVLPATGVRARSVDERLRAVARTYRELPRRGLRRRLPQDSARVAGWRR